MNHSFSENDLKQISDLGLDEEQINQQIQHFKEGFPKTELLDAATIKNGGILRLSDKEIERHIANYETLSRGKRLLKFVPASGAASRMFKDLYAFSSSYTGVAFNFKNEFPSVDEFLSNLRSFAFYNDLEQCMKSCSAELFDYMERGDYATIINMLLKEQYMGYGSLPKALLKFHKYGNLQRTPLEEHIVEGAEYARSNDGKVRIHFTVSPEHRPLFQKKIRQIRSYYEEMLGIKLEISFSEQKHYTDIIAVNEYNDPMRDENGKLIFRPGGHGALIENLNECRADLIFVKNIDNVVPDWMKHTTVVYKKALAGLLLETQEKCFSLLRALSASPDEKIINKAIHFAQKNLHIETSESFDTMTIGEQANYLFDLLNRPLRICGMVKNQGEPGGGPFFTRNTHGIKSLQIIETAQINRKDPVQEAILQGATHFNPVDLVCSTKDYRGHYFDLRKYVDPATGFISKKTKGAQVMKSQELPGLWNGAMAYWNTLFVEVPLATFNPVKSVNDLLRKEHQG